MREELVVLDEIFRAEILEDTIAPFGEAAYFAWRSRKGTGVDIRNGIYWREDGRRVISLATGAGLHAFGGVDWETYAFKGAAEGKGEDVCCHGSQEEANTCAMIFLLEGRYCTEAP